MRRPPALAATTLAAAVLLAAGCGNSSYSSGAPATSAAQRPTTSTAQSPAAASGGSNSTATAGASGGGTVVVAKHSKLGTIIAAGPRRLTIYLFEGDKGSGSVCTGACAKVWPPVTTTGSPQARDGANAADLGTITRSDGTVQVTYKGHPLYYFARDGDAGDAYGEGVNGFGASWYVLTPRGAKVDNS